MKAHACAIVVFLLSTATVQAADTTMSAGSAPVCLRVNEIKSTNSPDPHTILFHMINGKIWKNTLVNQCNGLQFNGFSYTAANDEVCANMQSIRVNQSGNICMLGAFTAYTPPSQAQ